LPHGHSWFDILFGKLFTDAETEAHVLGWPANESGVSWIAGGHISLQHVFAFAFVLLFLVMPFGLVAWSRVRDTDAALVPESRLTIRTFVELLVASTYGMMADMMGKKAAKFFLPLIGTCAFVVFFSNALGLIPGFAPPTDNLNTTLACSIIIFFTTHVYGFREHGVKYFKHFLGPIWWLAWLLLPIEIIGHLVRPISLSVRLMANMTADHLVLGIFHERLFAFLLPVPIYMLGALIVTVQTLVFCLLSTVYISMAIAHEEH